MAKIISPVWSIIRGSIAGTTYLSGPNNSIIARQKTAPVNPQTTPQAYIRDAIKEAAALWKEVMTNSDREKWSVYAATLSLSGPLGPYTISGQQAFIQSYSTAVWAQKWGFTPVPSVDPPDISGFLDTAGYQIEARVNAGTGVQLNAVNYAGEAVSVIVQVSGPWNESKNFFVGPWDSTAIQGFDLAASTSASFDINTAEDARKYFFRIKALSQAGPIRTQPATILSGVSNTI
jgi:hypothetical protein